MRNYEIMYIVRTTISEEEMKEVVNTLESSLTGNGAKIVENTDMGQRDLAYEINHYNTGHYYLYVVEANDDKAIKEFDRLCRINRNVIRHLITKIEK